MQARNPWDDPHLQVVKALGKFDLEVHHFILEGLQLDAFWPSFHEPVSDLCLPFLLGVDQAPAICPRDQPSATMGVE